MLLRLHLLYLAHVRVLAVLQHGAILLQLCFQLYKKSVLGICDIFGRIRGSGSAPLTINPDPDLTPFFSDFKDAKKIKFFSYNLPVGTLSSVLKFIFC